MKGLLITQLVICILCLLVAGAVNVWAFPATNVFTIAGFLIVLLICVFVLLQLNNPLQKIAGASVAVSVLVFFLLNANFYPQLLRYQAGNEMAFETKNKVDAKNVYFWPGIYSSSYNFYTAELRKEFTDAVLQQPSPVWIMTGPSGLAQIKQKGLPVLESYEQDDYEITTMQLPFINPATRRSELTKMMLVRVK